MMMRFRRRRARRSALGIPHSHCDLFVLLRAVRQTYILLVDFLRCSTEKVSARVLFIIRVVS